MKLRLLACSLFAAAAFALPFSAYAGEGEEHSHEAAHIEKQDWSFKGAFGTYDRASLQRGFEVYRQVCAACHSMSLLSYRDLSALGYSEDQVKAIASDATVTDGPNDEGDMFDRPGRPSDRFKAPFANNKAAMYANNGAYPPDMSLLAKARHGGADYIYAILTGYEEPPAGTTLMQGQHWNKAMPGHIIAMAQPISDGMVSYEDGTEGTLHNYAHDVATFLTWAAEPHMEARKRMGTRAFIFLLVFTFIMYGVKKRVWRDVH
ncbi:MAG TPA: cytochrome c1 [Alphaproteobacteria bacterium]|jgi:ubiquinol-cytochrome c reductase cytochrome c1 subunit